MLVLFGLIFRAIAVEYADRDPKHAKFWQGAFFIGSAVPALLFGAAVGNVIQGVALGSAPGATAAQAAIAGGQDYIGGFFALLNPFALLCAVLGLVAIITQGAAWLALKAPLNSNVHERATQMRSIFHIITLVCFVLVSVFAIFLVMPSWADTRTGLLFAWVFAVICAVGWVVARLFMAKKNDLLSFIGVNVTPVALIGISAASLFPFIVPAAKNPTISGSNLDFTYFLAPGAADPANSLTILGTANSEVCLMAMLIITCIGLPRVLAYHVIIYRTFRGRLHYSDDLEY
jgi:cytochrome d ubiquinol oxidase subunit II